MHFDYRRIKNIHLVDDHHIERYGVIEFSIMYYILYT